MSRYGIIYRIRNKINNKCYIGQTIRNGGFKRRYSGKGEGIERVYNCSINNDKCNEHLLRAISKYGLNAFEVDEEFDVAYSEYELNRLEEMYITIYNLTDSKYGYNKQEGGLNKKKSISSKLKFAFNYSYPVYCETNKKCYYSCRDVETQFDFSEGRVSNGLRKFKKYKVNVNNEIYVFYRLLERYKRKNHVINMIDGRIFKSSAEVRRYYGFSNGRGISTLKRFENFKLVSEMYTNISYPSDRVGENMIRKKGG